MLDPTARAELLDYIGTLERYYTFWAERFPEHYCRMHPGQSTWRVDNPLHIRSRRSFNFTMADQEPRWQVAFWWLDLFPEFDEIPDDDALADAERIFGELPAPYVPLWSSVLKLDGKRCYHIFVNGLDFGPKSC